MEYGYAEGDEDSEMGPEMYEDAQVDVEQEEVVVTAEAAGDEQPSSSQLSKKEALNKDDVTVV